MLIKCIANQLRQLEYLKKSKTQQPVSVQIFKKKTKVKE